MHMENWQDQGIVLSVRPHGENGGVVSILTKTYGRYAGYIRGANSSRMRGVLEQGNMVDVRWQSRTSDSLGSFTLELISNPAAKIMGDPLKLAALQSASDLCDAALPEREGHEGLFHGLNALYEALETDIWAPAYVLWELAMLKELGFSLDLKTCAGGGDAQRLAYVSPKTGRAVSIDAGKIYKDRLLRLPEFLRPQGGGMENPEILKGLEMTAHFLEHWVFNHHTRGIPETRLRFQKRFADKMDKDMTQSIAQSA